MKKPDDARRREAGAIRAQLGDLGFPEEALREVEAALEDFCTGWGLTKTYRMPELGVAVLLQLSTQAHVVSFARVRKLG